MGHQSAPNNYFNHDTLKNSELAKVWSKTLADLHKYELISSNIIVVNDFGSLFPYTCMCCNKGSTINHLGGGGVVRLFANGIFFFGLPLINFIFFGPPLIKIFFLAKLAKFSKIFFCYFSPNAKNA